MKGMWVEIRTGRNHSLIAIMNKTWTEQCGKSRIIVRNLYFFSVVIVVKG